MLAIVRTGGKQYIVKEGQKLEIEKIEGNEGDAVKLSDVLMVSDEKGTDVGTPIVSAKVEATITRQFKAAKVEILKFKAKTGYRRKKGHRQQKTEVLITKIAR